MEVNGGREGGEDKISQTDTWYGMLSGYTLLVKKRWKGPNIGSKGPEPGSLKGIKTKNTISEKEKQCGMAEVGGGMEEERTNPDRYSFRKVRNRKGTHPLVDIVNLPKCRRRGWR